MKILFTNSPLHFTHGHTFTQFDWQTYILPYLAGIAGPEHEIKLLDNMHYSFFKSNNILNSIEEFKPDIVGFSIIASRDIFNTIAIIKKVREKYPKLILMAGGQAANYYYQWLHEVGIDFIVHGEGEETIPELLAAIKNGATDFSKIKGISYKPNGVICKNEPRPLLKNLDDTPLPRFDLMPKLKSLWFPGRYTGAIEMARGCPFGCNFCAISAFWKSFRQKSNERILQELRILKQQGRTHLYLSDDNFGMDTPKQIALFKQMIAENLDMKFFAQIRADTIARNPEMMEWAAKAGLYGVLVGFDTYVPNMFNDVDKTTTREMNIAASNVLRKNKIAIFGTHIYGLPTQKNPLDFWVTFSMGRKYSDLFRMPHFSPLPFTKNYEKYVSVTPLSQSLVMAADTNQKDFRPRVGEEKQKKRMIRGYYMYNWLHLLSPDEFAKTLFHPNPNVRTFKRRGYAATFRHYFYRGLRRLNLTDI